MEKIAYWFESNLVRCLDYVFRDIIAVSNNSITILFRFMSNIFFLFFFSKLLNYLVNAQHMATVDDINWIVPA